jgi:hypothetical protein
MCVYAAFNAIEAQYDTAAVFDANEGHYEHFGTKSTMSGRNKAILLYYQTVRNNTQHTIVVCLVCGCSMADAQSKHETQDERCCVQRGTPRSLTHEEHHDWSQRGYTAL